MLAPILVHYLLEQTNWNEALITKVILTKVKNCSSPQYSDLFRLLTLHRFCKKCYSKRQLSGLPAAATTTYIVIGRRNFPSKTLNQEFEINMSPDLKHTLRLIFKKRSFNALCISIIAMGLAIAIPLTVLTKFMTDSSLPFPNGERFAAILEVNLQNTTVPSSAQIDLFTYRNLEERLTSFDTFGAYRNIPASISDGEIAELFAASLIMPNVFNMASQSAILGRSLQESDSLEGTAPVAVIGFNLWQSYYAGVEDIIGLQTRINGVSHTIIGVMAENFSYPFAQDLWLPLILDRNPEPGGDKMLYPVGLLKAESSFASAKIETESILLTLSTQFPEHYRDRSGTVLHYTRVFNFGVVSVAKPLFFAFVASIILLVSFNVGNLLMISCHERNAEVAIRTALGGTRWRVMLLVLLESFILCFLGAIIGLVVGKLGMDLVLSSFFSDATLPFWLVLSLQMEDLYTVIAIAILMWILSGVYPAWKICNQNISSTLSNESQSSTRPGKFTRLLISMEIITSCFLLIICSSFVALIFDSNNVDLGVNSDDLITATVDLSLPEYNMSIAKLDYLENLNSAVQNRDDFIDMSYTSVLAGRTAPQVEYAIERLDFSANRDNPSMGYAWVGTNYFELMQVSLIAGRHFELNDNIEGLPVIIIDELFANNMWPGESPIGKNIQFNINGTRESLTIIGIISHIIQGSPTGDNLYQSTFYRPAAQLPLASHAIQERANTFSVIAKTLGLDRIPFSDHERLFRLAGNQVDRDVHFFNINPLSDAISPSNSFAYLMLGVAVVAVALTVVGIYGIISRSIILRSKEIGIRRALGSNRSNILFIFFREGSGYLLSGLLIGGIGALLVLNLVAGSVTSLSTILEYSAVVFTFIYTCLIMLVFAATYIPANKVVTRDLGMTLRHE